MNLYLSVNNVLKRLDDYPAVGGEREWDRSEIELYVKDGYNAFCRRTKAVFDMFYPENVATCGNYVAKWEENYFEPGMIATGLLNFTGGYWEQDYGQAGAIGPITSTQPWEEEYLADLETLLVVSRGPVPEDNVTIDRATHDYIDLDPEYTRHFEEHDRNFQTVSGTPTRFSFDRDGIGTLRLAAAGPGDATESENEGTFGLLRFVGDDEGFGTWAPEGTWGCLRMFPEHFHMGGQYGIPRRLFSDVGNARAEYFRLGSLEGLRSFDIPDRFVCGVEYYAVSKALERDGPGQDLGLAGHFMQRFEDGVSRMIRRLGEHKRSRGGAIGSAGKSAAKPALARLPYQYGRQIRRGY